MLTKDKSVVILGTTWDIFIGNDKEFPELKNCDGYADKTGRLIVVQEQPEDNELQHYDKYMRKVIRHEIIHAFLFESGLHENMDCTIANGGHPEMLVDWFAVQFPKILKAFRDAGALVEGDME